MVDQNLVQPMAKRLWRKVPAGVDQQVADLQRLFVQSLVLPRLQAQCNGDVDRNADGRQPGQGLQRKPQRQLAA